MLARLLRTLFGRRGRAADAAHSAPDDAPPAIALARARACAERGEIGAARVLARALLARDAARPGALYLLGVLAQRTGANEEALDLYDAAIDAPGAASSEEYPLYFASRGRLLVWFGDLVRGLADLERAIALRPDLAIAHSVRLLALLYRADVPMSEVRAAHERWAQLFADPHTPAQPMHSGVRDGARDPRRRLRIGYVSPDFRRHSVAWFFEPLLAQRDRAQFEVILYPTRAVSDEVTARLRAAADGWGELFGLDDAAAARRIADDAIDVLVDLAGHTDANRLGVFAHRPAPVQITWLGYPATTGMRAMDWRITDAVVDPPGAGEAHYVERLLRLPRCLWCFRAPASPDPGPLPARARGTLTFGSFNNIGKLSDPILDVWARVLRALPGSRLLIAGADSWETRLRVRERLVGQGLEEARIVWQSKHGYDDYLQLRREVDISLDSFPFGGGTTTCESLWMGVPVVNLAGDRYVSRAGRSILAAAGLPELAVDDADAFVATAVRLAGDLDALAGLRAGLRARMAASELCDEPGFTRAMEAAYREAWRDWCLRPD